MSLIIQFCGILYKHMTIPGQYNMYYTLLHALHIHYALVCRGYTIGCVNTENHGEKYIAHLTLRERRLDTYIQCVCAWVCVYV